jgi:hypothetical protein
LACGPPSLLSIRETATFQGIQFRPRRTLHRHRSSFLRVARDSLGAAYRESQPSLRGKGISHQLSAQVWPKPCIQAKVRDVTTIGEGDHHRKFSTSMRLLPISSNCV